VEKKGTEGCQRFCQRAAISVLERKGEKPARGPRQRLRANTRPEEGKKKKKKGGLLSVLGGDEA